MRAGALGMIVVAWLGGCDSCAGALGPAQPPEIEAREIAQRYAEAHLGELAAESGAWAEGCPAITAEMLDDAHYVVTPGTVDAEPAARVTAELGSCEVDVAVVLVLEDGVWTAVHARALAHDGASRVAGRPLAFHGASSDGEHHHHHR